MIYHHGLTFDKHLMETFLKRGFFAFSLLLLYIFSMKTE
jgi:hypothetical protein